MSEVLDVLQKYSFESQAIWKQLFAENATSQKQIMQMQIEQAQKLALRDEIRANLHDATIDSFHSAANYLVNWQQVLQGREENKAKSQVGMAEDSDFAKYAAEQELANFANIGGDYSFFEDEVKVSEKEAADFDENI